MKPLIIEAYPELSELGAFRVLKGTLDETSYKRGAEVLETPEGIFYDLTLTNTGEGILLSGTASCTAQASCARCLAPATLEISGDVEGYYSLEPVDTLEGYEQDEFDCLDEDGKFDAAGPIEAALVYATPFVILCKEDCKGLCPTCGADLNEGPCACDSSDDIDPDNPFAVLKNLTLNEE